MVVLELFLSFTFYFSLLFYFLFLSFFLMTDGDSMITNNLRDSANGTFVTLDDSTHFTLPATTRVAQSVCCLMTVGRSP